MTETVAPTDALDPETHRRLGKDLYNHTWTLIETPDRTPEQVDEMIAAAHASAWHWFEGRDPGQRGQEPVADRARVLDAQARRAGAVTRSPLPRAGRGRDRRGRRRRLGPGRGARRPRPSPGDRRRSRGRGDACPCPRGPRGNRRPRGSRVDRAGPEHHSGLKRSGLAARASVSAERAKTMTLAASNEGSRRGAARTATSAMHGMSSFGLQGEGRRRPDDRRHPAARRHGAQGLQGEARPVERSRRSRCAGGRHHSAMSTARA